MTEDRDCMTESHEHVSEAIEHLKEDTSGLAGSTMSIAKDSLADVQESLRSAQQCLGELVDKYSEHTQRARDNPLANVMQSAGFGFLVGWLINKNHINAGQEEGKETEMGARLGVESEAIRILQKKIKSLQDDITELTDAAGEELQCMAEKVRDRYEHTSKAARHMMTENPVKTSVIAGAVGLAAGFFIHLMLQRHEG